MYTHYSYVDDVTESFWDLLLFSVTPMLCPYNKYASHFPQSDFQTLFSLVHDVLPGRWYLHTIFTMGTVSNFI
jgi:hypothetical protein